MKVWLVWAQFEATMQWTIFVISAVCRQHYQASDLVLSEQKHMAGSGEFPSNFVTPSIVDSTIAVQPVVSIRCYVFVAILVVSLLEF